jgi:hypothetical protein
LEELGPAAVRSVTYEGFLWISYPERSAKVETDIIRDKSWDVILRAGLRPVTQVSIDGAWSALRFRQTEQIGKSR